MKYAVRSLLVALLLALPASAWAERVGILVFDGVLTSDVTAPAEALGMAMKLGDAGGWSVELVSAHDRATVTTYEGLRLGVDHSIAKAPRFDVLVVPGSYDTEGVLALPGLAAYLERAAGEAALVASNCAGAFLVASTGHDDGRRVTTYATGAAALRAARPAVEAVEGRRVVVDGARLSSNGGVVSYEAALVLVARLFDRARARQVFEALQMNQTMPWAQVEAHLPAGSGGAKGAPASQPASQPAK